MLELKEYDLKEIKEKFHSYFKNENTYLSCDYTLGEKLMWHKYFKSSYAIVDETLTFKEVYDDNCYSFYYPMGKNIDEMFSLIKEYELNSKCKKLEFCCVDESHLEDLKKRFPHSDFYFDRNWSDYIYLNKDFQTFAGGAYSSKRHHVKQFKKDYPNAIFRKCSPTDKDKIISFIHEFSKTKPIDSEEADNELNQSITIANDFDELGLDCFCIEIDNKIIAISICEILNDCIYDHVEKALREYKSVYPYFVQCIANYYKDIKYFSREDDSGDEGLRYSKLEYKPIKLVNKYMFYVRNNLDLLNGIPTLKVNDLISLTEIKEEDKDEYFELNVDKDLNKYWAYDYTNDLNGRELNPDFFYNMVQDDFNDKTWFSFAIRKAGKLIGEIVLGEANNNNECMVGYRLKKSERKQGFTYESMRVILEYLYKKVGLSGIKAKACHENTPSINLLKKLGFVEVSNDETFKYFKHQL